MKLSSLLFITTYNRDYTNFHDLFTRFWPNLARSSVIKDVAKKEIVVTLRKPASLRDMYLEREKMHQTKLKSPNLCNSPNFCQNYCRISWTGTTVNHHKWAYNTTVFGHCQSNNLIYTWNVILACQVCRSNQEQNYKQVPVTTAKDP